MSWLERLKTGLSRTSRQLGQGITDLVTKSKLDEVALSGIEELLIGADLGAATAFKLTQALGKARFEQGVSSEAVRAYLAGEIAKLLEPVAVPLILDPALKPQVVLVVGVNGTGKTTTIGKLAHLERAKGRKVMLAAGDTFRAAAVEQLKVWGERTNSPVIARETGADAAGLAFDAVASAKAQGADILFVDTAGRLHNKGELMEELKKVVRVIKKHDETLPHATLLVLDATTGQNALNQVETFKSMVNVTGLVLTKLDGTAKGGVLVALAEKFHLPVHAIGVGEQADDLQPFDPLAFAKGLVGL
ncbi:MAG: signal recognition particle-docking protein FtsY [Rhodospirillales bacterium]|nr:MAG: signal recognition particle-docking protein FtsY [Rhodospirillales bacterium]